MSELLVCQYQYSKNTGFYAYNSNKIIVWSERIEKGNLYALVKTDDGYVVVKVIGLADCLVDQVKLKGIAVDIFEIDEDKINASYYDVREEKEVE